LQEKFGAVFLAHPVYTCLHVGVMAIYVVIADSFGE